jgi:hypothetical protein
MSEFTWIHIQTDGMVKKHVFHIVLITTVILHALIILFR